MEQDAIRRHARGLLGGYALQFLVGMILNLFVMLPQAHPGSSGQEYFARSFHSLGWALSFGGGWQLALHTYIALGLVLGSLGLCVHARILHDKKWTILGATAALFTTGAFFNGLSFIDYNNDTSSMIMATCWLIAVGTVVAGLLTPPAVAPRADRKKGRAE